MRKVLYVDDEEPNLFLFKMAFMNDFEVHTAISGSEGLELLQTHDDIDAIISDMKMPNMNGLEFIQEAINRHQGKVYFILTGFDKSPEIEEAIHHNMIRDYFRKPFDREVLKDAIESSLA